MTDDNLATLAVLPLLLHRPRDLTFFAVQHRASGRFANIPFTVHADGYIVDIGGERCLVRSFGQMLERATALSTAGHDIYLTIARYNAPFYLSDSGLALGARLTDNIRDFAALFVEIDVGSKSDGTPHAYQTHDDALAALDSAIAQIELPKPSIVINSGSDGAHAVWALDRPLPPDLWLDLTRRFVTALRDGGLVADWQQTTMQIAAPRLPGTFNWKSGEPRPVTITRLGGSPDALATLQRDTRQIVHTLASFTPAVPCMAANGYPAGRAGSKDNFTAGMTEPVTPQDVAALFGVLTNTGIDYNRWIRIAFACWVVVYQSSDPDAERIVHEAFVGWSLSYPRSRRGDRGWVDPEKTWKSTRQPQRIGDAIFVDLAREIDFWLPSRRAITHTVSDSALAQCSASGSQQQAEVGASLLKRVKAHFRLARRSRGLLEAQRRVYRLLLAEPREDVLSILRNVVRFLLTESAERDPLIAFAGRMTADGEAFVAKVEQRIAATKVRSAEQLRSHEDKAADLSDIFRVAIQRNGSQAATPAQTGEEGLNGQ